MIVFHANFPFIQNNSPMEMMCTFAHLCHFWVAISVFGAFFFVLFFHKHWFLSAVVHKMWNWYLRYLYRYLFYGYLSFKQTELTTLYRLKVLSSGCYSSFFDFIPFWFVAFSTWLRKLVHLFSDDSPINKSFRKTNICILAWI